jgi:hypothetical protein
VAARSESPHESIGSAIDWAGAEKRDPLAKRSPWRCAINCAGNTGYECGQKSNPDLTAEDCEPENIVAHCDKICHVPPGTL